MFSEVVAVGTKSGVQVFDLRRGTKLAQAMHVPTQTFVLTPTYILAASTAKPLAYTYTLNRGDSSAKHTFPLSEPITVFHSMCNDKYTVGGCASGRILVWMSATGQLLKSWDAHYGNVTALASDQGVLVSGGEDAAVHVWVLAQALESEEGVAPVASMSEHTMPVTALAVAPGLMAGRGRVVSAARDQTCKIWSLHGRWSDTAYSADAQVLATLLYPAPVNDVAVDAQQSRVFAATANGLFQTNLYENARALGGTADAVVSDPHVTFPGSEPVRSVALNFDGSVLAAMGDSAVRIWDVASRQCVRSLADKQLEAGTAAKLQLMLAPVHLGGPVSKTSVNAVRSTPATQTLLATPRIAEIPIMPLQRLERKKHDAPATAFEATVKVRLLDSTQEMLGFMQKTLPSKAGAARDLDLVARLAPASGGEQRVAELTRLVGRLEEHHRRTRRLNDELYQGAVSEWLAARQKQ